MENPRITLVIHNNTYRVAASDGDAIRKIPVEDRRHLINLLEAVKREHSLSLAAVSRALEKSKVSHLPPVGTRAAASQSAADRSPPTRLGSGDIDALMARLVVEEQQRRKPGITRAGIYKMTGGLLLLVFLLAIIF